MPKKDPAQFIGGFVRDRGEGRGVRVARSKADEIPPIPDPQLAQERVSAIARPGLSNPAINPIRVRKTKLAVMGIPAAVLDEGDPAYARCVRLAKKYRLSRCKELYALHGYVSTAVTSLISAASLALASSRYIYEHCSSRAVDNPQLLKLASSLGDSARQNELSAWELCARESVVFKRNKSDNVALPWEVVKDDGKVVRGRGRPRKVDLVLEEISNAGAVDTGETKSSSTESSGTEEPNGPGGATASGLCPDDPGGLPSSAPGCLPAHT